MKKLTIAQTLQAIKALPNMTASYNQYKEFRVRRVDLKTDYFTTEREDAILTAVSMSEYK